MWQYTTSLEKQTNQIASVKYSDSLHEIMLHVLYERYSHYNFQ